MRFELGCWSLERLREALKGAFGGQLDAVWENRDVRRWDGTRGGQDSRAGGPTLASLEIRKSRSWSFQVADRGRAEPRLGGGESLHNRHGFTALRAKP